MVCKNHLPIQPQNMAQFQCSLVLHVAHNLNLSYIHFYELSVLSRFFFFFGGGGYVIVRTKNFHQRIIIYDPHLQITWVKVPFSYLSLILNPQQYSVSFQWCSGGVSQNLSSMTNDSFGSKLLKSLLLISHQQICH